MLPSPSPENELSQGLAWLLKPPPAALPASILPKSRLHLTVGYEARSPVVTSAKRPATVGPFDSQTIACWSPAGRNCSNFGLVVSSAPWPACHAMQLTSAPQPPLLPPPSPPGPSPHAPVKRHNHHPGLVNSDGAALLPILPALIRSPLLLLSGGSTVPPAPSG